MVSILRAHAAFFFFQPAAAAAALLLAFFCSCASAPAAQGFAPLREQFTLKTSFAPESAPPGSRVALRLELDIDPEWHFYGKKESIGQIPSVTLDKLGGLAAAGALEVPDGERHEISKDPEIVSWYLAGKAVLELPLDVPADAKAGVIEVEGTLGYMQCTETMCDPPGTKRFSATLTIDPAAAAPAPAMPEVAPKARIVSTSVEPASARRGETVTVRLEIEVEKGWHVYGAKETPLDPKYDTRPQIRLAGIDWSEAGATELPDGELHEGEVVRGYWLTGRFAASRAFRVPETALAGAAAIAGEIEYQPCTEKICEKNERVPFTASLHVEAGAALSTEEKALTEKGLLPFILLAIGWGLFTLIMPCTYPMVPITVSFFTKQASVRGGRVLPLTATYGLGIVAVFIFVGLAFAPWIQPVATHWVTNLAIGVLFLFFAVVLFGAITLQPPAFLMNFAGQASARGGYFGAFLMGTVLVLTSFTCTAPFVANLLAVGIKTGSSALVILGMGVFGLTIAIPFVILSLVPGWITSLPRSGEWMNTTKVFLGFVEVAAALKFISNADLVLQWQILPRELFLFLWAAVFGAGAAFLFGWIRLKSEAEVAIGPTRMTIGLAVLLFAAYCLYGALGYRVVDPVMQAIIPNYGSAELGNADGNGVRQSVGAGHTIIKDDYPAALAAARRAEKLLLVNFTGYT